MKKSTKWFLAIFGVLMFFSLFAMLFFYAIFTSIKNEDEVVSGFGDRIAVIELNGIIMDSEEIVKQFKKYREDNSIKAILLRVDSPGGGVVASQEIYEAVRKTRESDLPVVVSMGSLGASGGYYVSVGANKIMANPGTLTGSIGVISEFMRFDSLMGKIGVGMNVIKSGKLKDAGSPFRKITKDDREYFQNLMNEVHLQFIEAVEKERKLDHDSLLHYADGRVFTGVQAQKLGLIDTIGTYEDAVALAAKLGHIKGKPAIVKQRKYKLTLFDLFSSRVGLDGLTKLKNEVMNQPVLQYRMSQGF